MYVTSYKDKFRAWETYKEDGTWKKVSVVMDRNTPQARKKAQEILNSKIPCEHSEMTFADLRTLYIKEQSMNLKEATWKRNKALLERIGRQMDDILIDDFSAGLIRRILIETKSKPSTFNEYLLRLKALFRWGYENDHVQNLDCIMKIKPLKDPDKKEKLKYKFFEKDELAAVVAAADPYDAAVISFLALSGLRIGEMIALEEDDISSDEIRINKNFDLVNEIVTSPKTPESNRIIYIQPELKRVIKELHMMTLERRMYSRRRNKLFVVSAKGDRFSYVRFERDLVLLSEKVIGRRLSSHSLRHTHVSLLAEAGVPLETISRRLGHSNSKITREIYLHVTEKTKEKDRDLIQKVAIL